MTRLLLLGSAVALSAAFHTTTSAQSRTELPHASSAVSTSIVHLSKTATVGVVAHHQMRIDGKLRSSHGQQRSLVQPMMLRSGGPPPNDNCATAQTLTVQAPGGCGVGTAGDNSQATQSTTGPSCDPTTAGIYADVWYSFSSGTYSAVTVNFDLGTMGDHVFVLYSACGGTELDCYVLPPPTYTLAVTPGTTYKLRVYSNTEFGAGGQFSICLEGVIGGVAPNDECGDAIVQSLSVPGTVTMNGDNTGATDSEGFGYGTVWEAFTIGSCANVTVDYCGTTPAFGNFFVDIAANCPVVTVVTNTSFVDCGDGNFIITFTSLAAGTYYIPVLMEVGVSEGPYTIEVTATACGAPPANDNCAGAIVLTPAAVCNPVAGTVTGATQSLAAITCNGFTGNANDDVWYSFVATSTSHIVHVDGADTLDAVVQLFSGPCAALVSLGCADATLGGDVEEIAAGGLTIGATYYVRVYDYYGGYPIAPNFTICIITPGPAPANDDCGSVTPTSLSVGGTINFTGDNTGATSLNEGPFSAYPTVWHAFTITTCANVEVSYCGTTPLFGNIWVSLSLDCPSTLFLTANTYNDTDCPDANFTAYYNNLAPGTYWLPVLQDATATGPYTIDVSATACTGGPANDDCANATVIPVNPPADCPANAVSGDNSAATQDGVLPSCDAAGTQLDVWYTFNSLTNTQVTIDVVPGTMTDWVVVVYAGCGGSEDTCFVQPLDPIVMPVTPGVDYVVRVYSNLGFGLPGTFTICVSGDFATGLVPVTTANWIVFPNPTEGGVTVIYGDATSDATIELVDVAGRLVLSERTRLVRGERHELPLAGRLSNGAYTLRITGATGTSEQRVVVE